MIKRNIDGIPTLADDDDQEGPSSEVRPPVVCVECSKLAPKTTTSHTLISARHGWRLRRAAEGASDSIEWLCPRCWDVYKSDHAPPSSRTLPPSSAPPEHTGKRRIREG
jgi:hypothetical protein